MTKYELCRLENHSLKQEIESLKERNAQLKDAVNRLQPIVDKYFLNSPDYRKRFLTVGSEWVCMVDCHGSSFYFPCGSEVTVTSVKDDVVELDNINDYNYVFEKQFLLCFAPKETPK